MSEINLEQSAAMASKGGGGGVSYNIGGGISQGVSCGREGDVFRLAGRKWTDGCARHESEQVGSSPKQSSNFSASLMAITPLSRTSHSYNKHCPNPDHFSPGATVKVASG